MDFYEIDTIEPAKHEKTGLSIDRLSAVLKVLDTQPEYKNLDSIMPHCIVFLSEGKFEEGVLFTKQMKKYAFAVVAENTIFSISHDGDISYAKTHEGEIVVEKTMNELVEKCPEPDLSQLNEEEKLAYKWLEQGETGASSKAICKTLYPNIKHHKLEDVEENNIPHDNADFNRCMKFLVAVPPAREKLSQMAEHNGQWKNLVNNWTKIEEHIHNEELTQSYDLIKKSIHKNSPKY